MSYSVAPAKRRVFFSFHYQQDIWRANQVRNSWRFKNENSREAEGFFDGSIWENARRTNDESLKSLIRDGISNTSVTAVLIGSATSERRWVRYEIARSVIKGNGLLGVRIHRLKNQEGYISTSGNDPFSRIGLFRAKDTTIRFAEIRNEKWIPYEDYSSPIDLPAAFAAPKSSTVVPLSRFAVTYCYVNDGGPENFSSWVQAAAASVGR